MDDISSFMKKLIYFLLIFTAFVLTACGGGNDGGNTSGDETSGDAGANGGSAETGGTDAGGEPKNLQEAMQQAQKAIEESGVGNQAEVVNFRELQELMPENLAGMERTGKGGQTTGAMGMKVSTAEATYKASDGTTVEITLADTGGLGMGMMGMAAWSTVEIDREDERGSERTGTMNGYKSYEKTRNRDQSCELSVIAEGRYIVTAKCRQCKMETLKSVVGDMNLGGLPKGEKK